MKEVKSVEKKLRNLFLAPKELGVDANFSSSCLDGHAKIPSPLKPPYGPHQPPNTTLVVALKTLIFTNDSFDMRTLIKYRENLPLDTFTKEQINNYHAPVCVRVRERLNDAFQQFTNGMFPDFSSWVLPYIDVPKQHRKFDVPIIPKGIQYWSELMYYMFFHKMNESRGPSLELFELLALSKIGHNASEGTQQIIGLFDEMKDGVASYDVEKDDVASCDDQEDVAATNLK
ncbi:hypothetical protein GUJ93_ZPchr0012g20020 [Zizania palustris]|uniref:Uncharacterized protein n=1 Tax=Zizania palustris TaxID=103762 RepID=A0A8J5WRA5_ZIZPA|nr:hypothetical protein GUJ93_ZPchr0012g20020 [Zizania palustris]